MTFTYNAWHYGIPGQRDSSIGGKLSAIGRVHEAEFEVIEPTKEQHGTEQSAGDGNYRTESEWRDFTDTRAGQHNHYREGWHIAK
jgi:hypothetical protein